MSVDCRPHETVVSFLQHLSDMEELTRLQSRSSYVIHGNVMILLLQAMDARLPPIAEPRRILPMRPRGSVLDEV